jgi:hypothetical protein
MSVEASPSGRPAAGGWLRAALLVAYVALVVPVLIVDVPPLVDYTNHNARLWLIAGGIDLGHLRDYYAIDWSRASVNIGIDLIAAGLGPLIGKTLVGPLCLILSIILPAAGALALHRRVFGAAHWWQLTFVLPAFGKTVLAGYMNFHIGVGLALLAASLDERLSRLGPVPAFIGRVLLTALVLIFHPFAAMGYGGLLLALAIGRDLTPLLSLRGVVARIGPGALAVSAAVVPVLAVMLLSPHPPVGSHTVVKWASFSLLSSLGDLLVAFHAYSTAFDGLVVLILGGVVTLAVILRRLSIHTGLFLAGVAFALITLVMPTRIGDGYDLEFRPPVLATYILLAAVRPDFALSRRWAGVLASLFFVLAVARTAVVGAAWVSVQPDVRAVRRALALSPQGVSLLTLSRDVPRDQRGKEPFGRYFADIQSYYGYPPLAVIQRHDFVPNIWAIAGQQPLRVRDAWLPMFAPEGDRPPHIADLYAPTQDEGRQYLTRWRRFDYIVLLHADAPPAPGDRFAAGDVDLVSDQGFAALYRVRHPSGNPAAEAPGR